MIPYISLVIFILLFAYEQSKYDGKLMPQFKSFYSDKVKHGLAWVYRGIIVSLVSIPYFFLVQKFEWILLLGFAGLFSLGFRFFLNKIRKAKWDYISISNWYDTIFYFISKKHGGKIAYGFELSLFCLSTLKHFNIL